MIKLATLLQESQIWFIVNFYNERKMIKYMINSLSFHISLVITMEGMAKEQKLPFRCNPKSFWRVQLWICISLGTHISFTHIWNKLSRTSDHVKIQIQVCWFCANLYNATRIDHIVLKNSILSKYPIVWICDRLNFRMSLMMFLHFTLLRLLQNICKKQLEVEFF